MGTCSYNCPYCGYEIKKDDILFVYEGAGNPLYEDKRRHSFRYLCSSKWANSLLEQTLYFFPRDAEGVAVGEDGEPDMEKAKITWDENGYPLVMTVVPCKGRTPQSLERDPEYAQRYEDYCGIYDMRMRGAAAAQEGELDQASAPEPPVPPIKTPVMVTTRACPQCHGRLHEKFGLIETINVAMMGGPSSGKTAYLIALRHQLSRQMGHHRIGVASLLADSESYYAFLNQPCIHMDGPEATPTNENLFPFIYYFKGNDTRECFISLYDIAGEDTRSNPGRMLGHHGIQNAAYLLMMIDPNQLCDGAFYKLIHGSAQQEGAAHDLGTYFETPVEEYLSMAVSARVHLGLLKNVRHVLFVMTKMDMPLQVHHDLFADAKTCRIRQDIGTDHSGGLDVSVIDQVQEELELFLGIPSNFGIAHDEVMGRLASYFKPLEIPFWSMLGVSVQTLDDPERLTFRSDWNETAAKHRIIEPILVILAASGMIPFYRSDTNPA